MNDPDYEWLLRHIDNLKSLEERSSLAEKVSDLIKSQLRSGALPYTLGIFGGWGSGKTTFLALIARELETEPNIKIVYFNSWKYAGLMEIFPSLVYKVLQYGTVDSDERTAEQRKEAMMKVLLSLGKEYSDRFGDWVEKRVGINPLSLVQGALELRKASNLPPEPVPREMLDAYYTQVDRAQDALKVALGSAVTGKPVSRAAVVLIDELDRCDPDEAFNVIKQMRVLFAMRSVPVVFVVCANPEPIGQAIKHRYGLESGKGDYEARRILEKFVDAYEDLGEPVELAGLVGQLWAGSAAMRPWIVSIDQLNSAGLEGTEWGFHQNVVGNATALDVINTDIPQFANLRVLEKTLTYVRKRPRTNTLFWTSWHLEILEQIDPKMRAEIAMLAGQLQEIVSACYASVSSVRLRVQEIAGRKRLVYQSDKGSTLFAIFRSYFWEHARNKLEELAQPADPESKERERLLRTMLADSRRVDFVVLMCLLPLNKVPGHKDMIAQSEPKLPDLKFETDKVIHHFAWLLANY